MSVPFTIEQNEFQDLLTNFFRKEVSSDLIHNCFASNGKSTQDFEKKLLDLGLEEYFSSSEVSSPDMIEAGILAYQQGYFSVPGNIYLRLLAGPLLGKNIHALISPTVFALVECKTPLLISKDADGKSTLSGEVIVLHEYSEIADLLIFDRDPKKQQLFKLEKNLNLKSLRAESLELLDRTARSIKITCNKSEVHLLDLNHYTFVRERVFVLVALELAGLAARACAMTVDYTKTRKQFGVPVGGFQAVQHRAAEMYLHTEAMTSLGRFAAWAAVHSPHQFALAAQSAILYASEHAVRVVESAIQMHGGIGFTWEYDLHYFLRRAKQLQILFGPSEQDTLALLDAAQGASATLSS